MIVDLGQQRQIHASVQGTYYRQPSPRDGWQMHVVQMEMDNIEQLSLADDFLHQNDMGQLRDKRVAAIQSEPQRLRRAGMQPRRSHRITGREQRDSVSLANQFFSQKRNNPFSSAVELGWNAFKQRRHNGYIQRAFQLSYR